MNNIEHGYKLNFFKVKVDINNSSYNSLNKKFKRMNNKKYKLFIMETLNYDAPKWLLELLITDGDYKP